MNVIQRRAVLPVILIAAIIAVLGTLLVRSQFVFGQEEPVGCDVSTVGLSIRTTDSSGNYITSVLHGDQIFYQVLLSIPELREGEDACNYSGGELSVTLPSGETEQVAGSDGGSEIPVIHRGTVYESPAVAYTVIQADATNMVLTVQANYRGGSSHSVPVGQTRPEAAGSISDQIGMKPPGIRVEIIPPIQVVYLGGAANFTVTVGNTGGFELSAVDVSDSLPTDCSRTFDTLAVRASTSYACSYLPGADATNVVTATAQVIGGVPASSASIEDSTTAEVNVETVLATIDLTPDRQQVRVGSNASITVVVENPSSADLTNVNVTVAAAPGCGSAIGALAKGETVTYQCETLFPQGSHTVTGVVGGQAAGVDIIETSDQVVVAVFELGLFIEKGPAQQIIHKGSTAQFTITVSNRGDSMLSAVAVTDSLSPDCSRDLPDLEPGSVTSYTCTSAPIEEAVVNEIEISATAPDGGPVSATASAAVNLIKPATVLSISASDSINLRLMINVLTITESNVGDDSLTDPYVVVDTLGRRLDIESPEYVGGDRSGDGVLDPGEVWEWRLITVAIVGNGMLLPEGSASATYMATGHGTDSLGADVTFPAVLTERDSLDVPIFN